MSDEPNVEALLQRARHHIDAGEAWRARRKLRTWLAQFPFDSRLARLLGELELLAGELPEAGRWLWLARSDDAEHRFAVDLFLAGASGEQLWNALPRSLHTAAGPPVPRPVEDALTERGVSAERRRRAAAQAPSSRQRTLATRILDVLICGGLFALFGLGVWKAVELIGRLFG